MRNFSFWPHQGLNQDLWITSPALYHCATVTSGFHLWLFQVFNSVQRIGDGIFLIGPVRDFLFGHNRFQLGTSASLVLHSTTVATANSGFHLWQFQVFNSGAEGLVVVIVLIGTVRDVLFGHTSVSTGDLWISSPAIYHCATATSGFHLWLFQVFNSGAEGLVNGIFLIGPVRDFLFGHNKVSTGDLWISSPALYHCAKANSGFHLWQFQVFHSGAEGLVVVLFWLDCERFLFWHTRVSNWGPLDLCPALYHCATVTSGFHLWQFQVFNSGAEGLVVVLFWLDLWEIFFFAIPGFDPGTSGSLVPALYHCATATSGFHLWQFQVFHSGAEGLVVVLFWLDCERFSFWGHTRFEPGTSGS